MQLFRDRKKEAELEEQHKALELKQSEAISKLLEDLSIEKASHRNDQVAAERKLNEAGQALHSALEEAEKLKGSHASEFYVGRVFLNLDEIQTAMRRFVPTLRLEWTDDGQSIVFFTKDDPDNERWRMIVNEWAKAVAVDRR